MLPRQFLVVIRRQRLRDGTGRSHVMEDNGSRHGGGHSLSKFAHLRMNVREPSVTAPPSEFLDKSGVHVVEIEGHCPGGSDGVGANSGRGETPVLKVCASCSDQEEAGDSRSSDVANWRILAQ